MSDLAFDTNILIDALRGITQARAELRRARRPWISRIVWIEVMSKLTPDSQREVELFLSGFGIDEIDGEIAERAASLRRERGRLKLPDAIILASAQVRGRILVTRNTRDFPVSLPGIRAPYTL